MITAVMKTFRIQSRIEPFERFCKILSGKINLLFFLCIVGFQNCYYNPVVYSLLNPATDEDDKVGILNFGLILGQTSGKKSFHISGVIRNNSGTAQTNKSFTITSKESNEPGLDESGTTDNSGRFFLNLGLGATKIKVVEESEPLVSFTLNVGPDSNTISVTEVDPPQYQVGGFITYDPNNKPSFFEVIGTSPGNKDTVIGSPSLISISFSENLKSLEYSEFENLVHTNLIPDPPFSFSSITLETKSFYLMPIGINENTNYTLEIKPGFISESGKSLNPYKFEFRVDPL